MVDSCKHFACGTIFAGLFVSRGVMENFDLGVIGAGPGGYTAALQAAAKGLKVVLFEKKYIGGVCLNKGCIPTKSILHSSEIFAKLSCCEEFGVCVGELTLNYPKVLERKNKVVEKLRKGIELALKNAKVTVVQGEAEIVSPTEIKAGADTYTCEKIICAVGSSPRTLKGLEFDHNFILSSDDVLKLETLPKSILIIGSGAIGIEWARIFSNFGVEVVLLELAPHLLPIADIEVSKRIERIFKSKKIKFYTNTAVEKLEGNKVIFTNSESFTPEKILVAAGRVPNKCQNIEGVTYIGDVTGQIQLAHFAIKEAVNKVCDIPFNKDLTPSVIYGSPEIAWAGVREQDLEQGTYQKSMTLVSSLGKSWCDGETEGFIKLLTRNEKIIGAHIVSQEASALLQQILIAMDNQIPVEKLKEVCFAHPTYSEGIFEALFGLK